MNSSHSYIQSSQHPDHFCSDLRPWGICRQWPEPRAGRCSQGWRLGNHKPIRGLDWTLVTNQKPGEAEHWSPVTGPSVAEAEEAGAGHWDRWLVSDLRAPGPSAASQTRHSPLISQPPTLYIEVRHPHLSQVNKKLTPCAVQI